MRKLLLICLLTVFAFAAAGQNITVNRIKADTVKSRSTKWVTVGDSMRVMGNLNIDSGLFIDNYRALYQRGAASSIYGGSNSGRVATTGGSFNAAFGVSSLYTLAGGDGNSAFGYQALYTNTGSNNTAVGAGALYSNTTSGYSTAIGYNALNAQTIQANNIALGAHAGMYNTLQGRLYINNRSTGSLKADTGQSIIYGVMDADSSKQHLWLNANVHAQTSLVVGNSGADSVYLSTTHGVKLTGAATVWDDFTVGATQTKVNPATSLPAFSADSLALQFVADADSNEIAYFSVQLPHSYKPGSSIHPHIHWIQHAAGDTTWNMRLAYRIHPISGTSGAWIYLKNTGRAALPFGTKPFHQICEFPAISTAGCKESTVIDFKLYRYDAVGLATVWFKQFDVHVEKNKMGSKNEFPD